MPPKPLQPSRPPQRRGLVPSSLLGLWIALAALPAAAVLIETGDGSGNTSAPSPDFGFAHVGTFSGGNLTLVYLGNGWVLTAGHVGTGDLLLDGVLYPVVPGSRVDIVHDPQGPVLADLALFRVAGNPELPDLPLLEIADATPPLGGFVHAAGNGRNRGAPTTWNPPGPGAYAGYEWGAGTSVRWGSNEVSDDDILAEALGRQSWSFWMDFDEPGSAFAVADEFIAAPGDSGGPVFVPDGGGWSLAGILILTATFPDQPAQTSLYGNATVAVDLARYRDQIIPVVRPACADEVDNDGDGLVDWPADPDCASEEGASEEPDADGDGVADSQDNCLLQANAPQCDSDLDGYGNRCDADFDQDGVVGGSDYNAFRAAFGWTGPPGAIPEDLDCDGAVGGPDANIFRASFGLPPGPSGLACAGSVPCP